VGQPAVPGAKDFTQPNIFFAQPNILCLEIWALMARLKVAIACVPASRTRNIVFETGAIQSRSSLRSTLASTQQP
jgi:hypothetical protein